MRLPASHRHARPFVVAALALVSVLALAAPSHAGPGDAAGDSVTLVGEFVDPVCIFQHGMQGALGRQCAMVRGRVNQGMLFLDLRRRKLYTVIGQTHWEDPKKGFEEALGDTFAIRAKVWRYAGDAAIAVSSVVPWRASTEPALPLWPWKWEWSVLAGCGLLALGYAWIVIRWRPRLGIPWRGADTGRAVAFGTALLVVIASLNGPLHDLSDLYLFSTHMVQHLLLAQVFPLLFLAGVPAWVWSGLQRPRGVGRAWDLVTSVPVGFVLYTLVFSMWHVPPLYNLMMRNHDFHIAMHLMVMATATWMWWPIAAGAAVRRPISSAGKFLYLFLLGIPMMAVAALITFASQPLYEWYALAPRMYGLSAVDDQRLGGLIMWVPGGLYYWLVMSVVFFRWSARESRNDDPVELPVPTSGAIFPAMPPLSLGKEKPVR